MSENSKFSIFHIEGGLGKHVAATAVAKCIKNNHPDRELIVVCAYPEVFINLSFVDRVYRIGVTPYFYDNYIKDVDSIIFKHEPYFTTNHIHKRLPLIENWCKLYELDYNGEQPELRFNLRQKQLGFNKWKRDKPIFLIHTNGGPISEQPYPYAWTRDMPSDLAQEVANVYSTTHHVIQVCRNKATALSNVEVVTETLSNSELFMLVGVSDKRFLIDSSLQHAAAALNLPSTVIWIGTSPIVFGYNIHNNIVADLSDDIKLADSYLFDYNFNGVVHECPIFNDSDDKPMFDLSEILKTL
jgi:hypothetical protein